MDIMNTVKKQISGVPYYNNSIYQQANAIADLPLISKYDAVEHLSEFQKKKPPIVYTQTSGSSGIILRIAWNYFEYLQSLMCLWRLRKEHSVESTDFYLTCHASMDIHGQLIDSAVILSKNSLSLSKLFLSEEIMQDYIFQIRRFQPKWIYAQPSFVYQLGLYLIQYAPEIAETFHYIELVGELLTNEAKCSIQKLYPKAEVVSMYGMQEFNGIMYEMNGMLRTIEENVYVEILRDDGTACDDNEEGNIVVTGLKNSVFPLVRYVTGDRGIRRRNSGGFGYEITSGRSNDEFTYQGKRYDGSIFLTVVTEYNKHSEKQIARFQVLYQNDILHFRVFYMNKRKGEEDDRQRLQDILTEIGDVHIPIQLECAESIQEFRLGGNKIKYFINDNN